MEHHNQSFFGQKTGLILDSAGLTDPWIFVRCLRKKESGQWEKPSANEGKNIKLNLLELIAIVQTLKVDGKWGTVHKFQEGQTQIVVENQQGNVKVQIGGYLKQFKFPESTLLLLLLEHILGEKIVNATNGKHSKSDRPYEPIKRDAHTKPSETIEFVPTSPSPESEDNIEITEQYDNPFDDSSPPPSPTPSHPTLDPVDWYKALKTYNEFVLVPGEILATRDKSVNFQILNGKPLWIPISQTMGTKDAASLNGLWIRKWLIEKKLVELFPVADSPTPALTMEISQ